MGAQRQIAELHQVSVKTANEHLVNIDNDGDVDPSATIRRFRIVQREGSRDVSIPSLRVSGDNHPVT